MSYILQQLLTRSAALYPEKVAVWARGRSLTYRELEERSNQLAHLLRNRGVKKGDRIGLFFPKCVESLVCMFGVLKAGGVYVPLDPQAPADRVGYIIGNCGIRVLLTNREKRNLFDASVLDKLDFCVMTDGSGANGSGHVVVPWALLAEQPASSAPAVTLTETCLLYTSPSPRD